MERVSENTQVYYEEFEPVFGMNGSWDMCVVEHTRSLDDGTIIVGKK